MDPDRFPVEWHDKDGKPITLGLGQLTVAVIEAFRKWLKPQMLADAAGWMPPAEYRSYRQELTAPGGLPWAADGPCSGIAIAMGEKAGSIYLNRLLFGDDVKGWSDERLWDLLATKDKDPASDYRIAFDIVWMTAHPKAQAPAKGPTNLSTNTSGTPASSPPITLAGPTDTSDSSAN
jgi:hypothetical protein